MRFEASLYGKPFTTQQDSLTVSMVDVPDVTWGQFVWQILYHTRHRCKVFLQYGCACGPSGELAAWTAWGTSHTCKACRHCGWTCVSPSQMTGYRRSRTGHIWMVFHLQEHAGHSRFGWYGTLFVKWVEREKERIKKDSKHSIKKDSKHVSPELIYKGVLIEGINAGQLGVGSYICAGGRWRL